MKFNKIEKGEAGCLLILFIFAILAIWAVFNPGWWEKWI